MANKIKFITAMDMLFLLLLALAGSASGITGEIFYYLAFLAPVGFTLNYLYKPKAVSDVSDAEARDAMLRDLKGDFTVSGKTMLMTLPVLFPAILAVLGVSVLTSAILGAFGYSSVTVFEEPFMLSLLTHALIPAVLEELLFRFVPIKLLAENKKTAFAVSAVMFAFAHANLFQIPYALLAGAIMAGLYVVTGSILPSMLLHFLNNAISLLSIYGYLGSWFIPALAGISAVSLCLIIVFRKEYKNSLANCFSPNEKITLCYYPLFFIGTALILAVSALFA